MNLVALATFVLMTLAQTASFDSAGVLPQGWKTGVTGHGEAHWSVVRDGSAPSGTNVLLQSNDYFSEPTHINCVASLAAFEAMAALREVRFSGELPTKNYTRFMLIGTV